MAALLLVAYLLPGTALAEIIDFQELSYEAGTFRPTNANGTVDRLYNVTGNDDDFGEAVSGIGDLDGDEIPDLILTAQDKDDGGENTGAIWFTFLNRDGTVKFLKKISKTEPNGFTGDLPYYGVILRDGAQFGGQVGNLGDLDSNGFTDIIVSSRPDDDDGTLEDGGTRSTGAMWILFLAEDRNGSVTVIRD